MGHSFDAGRQHPPLPKDLKSLGLGLAASSEKRKSVGTPRSPVLSSPSDDYGEIREFLRTEPPPPPPSDYLIRDQSSSLLGRRPLISLRGDSHRKKHSLDEIFKSGYLSSKQLKHLLLRSRSTSLARKSTAEGLAKDVALQKAIGGREYRQIVADPARVQSSGNLSVYKVNCRREQQGVEPIVMEHKDTPTHDEPVIPTSQSPSQILEGDAFGISKEFPHLWPLTDAVTTTPQNNTSTETYAPPISIPRQGVGSNIRDFGSQSKDTASDTQFAVHAKHPATVSDYPNSSFQSRHNKGLLSNPPTSQTPKGGPRNWMRRSPRPLPLDIQARSQQQTPPRPSSRPLGSELNADSPPHLTPPLDSPPNKQSSTHPGSASTAYDIHSDTSSGKVMSAQSLDMIRFQGAGYLNNKSRKPPKPSGPAPTRALPLLPEDHDPLNASNRISIGPANGQTSIVGPHFDQSPNQLPQKPPSRRYGYPAFDILNSNLTPTNVPPRAKTAPDLNQHRMQSVGSVSPEEGENSSASRKLDGEPSTAGMSPDVLTEWATRRDQVTKERKKRDLEREREARHRWETKKFVDINSSEEDTIPRDAEWQQQDNTDTIVTLPSVENDSGPHPNNNDSPCSTASAGACKSPASQSSAQSASDSNSIKRDPPKPPRSQQCHLNADSDSNSNKISPVLLIAEQAPIYATEYCKMQTTTFKSPTSTNAHRSLESTSKNTNTQKSHQRQEKESQMYVPHGNSNGNAVDSRTRSCRRYCKSPCVHSFHEDDEEGRRGPGGNHEEVVRKSSLTTTSRPLVVLATSSPTSSSASGQSESAYHKSTTHHTSHPHCCRCHCLRRRCRNEPFSQQQLLTEQLEARLSSFERKTTLLEAALLFFLSTATQRPPPSQSQTPEHPSSPHQHQYQHQHQCRPSSAYEYGHEPLEHMLEAMMMPRLNENAPPSMPLTRRGSG